MTIEAADKTHGSIRRHLIGSAVAVGALFFGIGGWAATTEVSGAVIAAGSLVVDTNVKKVQHPTGGVVGEVNVRDGDRVTAGQVLVRLDETITRANLAVVSKSLDELEARQARLEAERDGTDRIVFPDRLTSRVAADPAVERIMASETRLFELRRTARDGQKAQLQERISQLAEEISGLERQSEAKESEIALIAEELKGVLDLWKKNLIPIQRVTALKRDAARLEGEYGQIVAGMAQSKGKISEINLQILQIDQELRSEVAKELREIQAKTSELGERKVAAEDQLRRIEIRAPQNGIVHQSTVHTVGGVIAPGEALMMIVPESDALMGEARIDPVNIDQVKVGQVAQLRFTSFSQRTTPEIFGTVARVSADVSPDQRTGASYYVIRVTIPPEEIARLESVKLLPGMPVEIFVKTQDRTVLSYLSKPLTDQLQKAFREK